MTEYQHNLHANNPALLVGKDGKLAWLNNVSRAVANCEGVVCSSHQV